MGSPLEHALANCEKEELVALKDRNFKNILIKMFTHDHELRPSAAALCQDKFFKPFVTQPRKRIPTVSGWCKDEGKGLMLGSAKKVFPSERKQP